ncbi:MAG: hypothetical protein C7B46_20555 [Sulfobacillus benefaciens]|uniref:XRE family transcriptional regulator n=1 Tax=Sulfobacillus benefaciens TaxID=453960 RepID=A0A2T2WTY5_9FIRM|nr:MAG: hypothetical protein C7B46_20555 [Sulfobacillus benefaciens]
MRHLPSDIVHDDQALREFLKTDWILQTLLLLETARKNCQYSPQELADRLGTTPAVILRTEHDSTGQISVRRYAEWLLACNIVPQPLVVDPWLDVKADAIRHSS